MAETNFDRFKEKYCGFMTDWLKTKGLHKTLFRGIIVEEAFKVGIKAEDGLIT